jgi:hypothetical protein
MKIGREAGIPNSVNDAAGGACNVVRLSFASMAERTVFNGRRTVQQPLTATSASDQSAYESRAD